MVERDTFISFATCAIDLLPSFIMSNARASCSVDNALFLPPFRPRALAAARPALVRSISLSRSNSARAAAMWK